MDLSDFKSSVIDNIDNSVNEIKIHKLELEVDILKDELFKLVNKTENIFGRLHKKVKQLSEYKTVNEHNKQLNQVLERIETLTKTTDSKNDKKMDINDVNKMMNEYIETQSNVVDCDRKKYPARLVKTVSTPNNKPVSARVSKTVSGKPHINRTNDIKASKIIESVVEPVLIEPGLIEPVLIEEIRSTENIPVLKTIELSDECDDFADVEDFADGNKDIWNRMASCRPE